MSEISTQKINENLGIWMLLFFSGGGEYTFFDAVICDFIFVSADKETELNIKSCFKSIFLCSFWK